ncbi:unnamed protein product [Eruca vesicaria subsp. sativa]|uniref:Histone deacetylase domain-containing protein n=1 Tax=Eruca vesicaria subsp. sativa TaxID=29727 RepID=A0ABC8K8M8_ERUVS|nr:unnamed protein product [Eruca vesicaria subsp. sativa]
MKEEPKNETLKNWEKMPSSPKRVGKSLKKKRGSPSFKVPKRRRPSRLFVCATVVHDVMFNKFEVKELTLVQKKKKKVKELTHAERPDRLRAIAASLATAGLFPGRCYSIHAREIFNQWFIFSILEAQTLEHVDAVDITSQLHNTYFTSDTYANEYSARASRLAAGLCADLAKEILSGRVNNGFALVRPPGHHAGIKHSMGFCLHNNAVAALVAQAAGEKKALIVDWDVHHGNGTQEIFKQNKSVLYISLHIHEGGEFYPGTGAADEVGRNGGEGYCVNVPCSCGGVGDKDYIYAFQHVLLPIASAFSPDYVIVSAGFDAARGDPLGCCDVTPTGYSRMTQMLGELCGGRCSSS